MNLRHWPARVVYLVTLWLVPILGWAGGVTLITHGWNGNVTGWVPAMGDKFAQYPTFPGTNVAIYRVAITSSGGQYPITTTFEDGTSPTASDSGEVIVLLDWSTIAGGGVPTPTVAARAAAALLATNLIPELAGRPLAQLPLHLVGHSRGASVITELARELGAVGVWVDHVTMLDPVPVAGFGDPPITNYANILFADNYWQSIGGFLVPVGSAVAGAYNRQLTSLGGGYSNPHSDTHLWYHGTAQWATPASDTEATLTAAERGAWWTAVEQGGTNTGYLYSRIGRGNRLSSAEPAGAGKGRIRDGYNQDWDLGLGVSPNRSSLPGNNGQWPNLIRFERTGTNTVGTGQPVEVALYYQAGASTGAVLRVFLDSDQNPWNGTGPQVHAEALPTTGTSTVGSRSLSILAQGGPGVYRVLASVSSGGLERFVYAPQPLVLAPSLQPPVLLSPRQDGALFRFQVAGDPGQRVVLEFSSNLVAWLPMQTNQLVTGTLEVSLDNSGPPNGFFRARLAP